MLEGGKAVQLGKNTAQLRDIRQTECEREREREREKKRKRERERICKNKNQSSQCMCYRTQARRRNRSGWSGHHRTNLLATNTCLLLRRLCSQSYIIHKLYERLWCGRTSQKRLPVVPGMLGAELSIAHS